MSRKEILRNAKTLHQEDYIKMAFNVANVVIKETEAEKVIKYGENESKVVQKITWSNFYKNSMFWKGLALSAVASLAGENVEIATTIIGILF